LIDVPRAHLNREKSSPKISQKLILIEERKYEVEKDRTSLPLEEFKIDFPLSASTVDFRVSASIIEKIINRSL